MDVDSLPLYATVLIFLAAAAAVWAAGIAGMGVDSLIVPLLYVLSLFGLFGIAASTSAT